NLQPLAVHVVVFDPLHSYRLEGTGTHVQGDFGRFHAEVADRRQQLAVEMQPRRGRRHRTGALRIDRLIPFPVGTLVRPIDIGRQRHMADAIKQRQNRLGKAQLEQGIVARQHADLAVILEQDATARLGRLAGPYMGQHPVLVQHPFHQDFQLPAGFLAPEQARRYDPGIVEYHQVARPQVLQQLGEPPVLQGTAGAIETQQPAGSAFGQRMTGDEAVRQVEMEIADAHERHTGIAEKGANGSGKPPSRPWKPLTGAAKPPYTPRGLSDASVAELVDAADSKSASGDRVGVRFSPGAPFPRALPREWPSTAQTSMKNRPGAGFFVGEHYPPLPLKAEEETGLTADPDTSPHPAPPCNRRQPR